MPKTPEGPWRVGSSKQLFIDHRFIESSENIGLTVNPPVKRSEPVIRSDRPWDAFRLIWFSVAEDNGQFKMWYQAFDNDQWAGGTSRLCYAVSDDGLNWTKPDLGIVEYRGSTQNNILIGDMVNAFVFIDPHGEPEQCYKMIYTHRESGRWRDMRVAASADGIHWELPSEGVYGDGGDTQPAAYWDARISRYVVYFRVGVDGGGSPAHPFVPPTESDPPVVAPKVMRPGRAVGRLEMDDILTPWPDENVVTVLTADELDPTGSDIYTHSPYPYPHAADAYFLFPMTYQHFRDGETDTANDGVNDAILCASRDGIHWMRYDRRSYISRGLPGEPDAGMVQPTAYHVRVGNYLYHYYGAWPWTHGGYRRLTPEQRRDKANWGRQRIGVAVQRLDGFVSADAPYAGGWLITPPLAHDGNRLELNVNVDAMGELRVEIQDEQVRALPGFSLEECERILANDVAYTVKWKGNPDVSALRGKTVRLRFVIRAAKLYAFQFVKG